MWQHPAMPAVSAALVLIVQSFNDFLELPNWYKFQSSTDVIRMSPKSRAYPRMTVRYGSSLLVVRPLPTADLRTIDAELVRMTTACNLAITEFFFGVCADPLKFRDRQYASIARLEPVRLVLNCQFHRAFDVALLLVAAHVQVAMVCTAIGKTVNQPWITMEVKDDRLIDSKRESKSASVKPCGCSVLGCSLNKSTTLMNRIFRSGNRSRSRTVAANASWVGISPRQPTRRPVPRLHHYWPNSRYRYPLCSA